MKLLIHSQTSTVQVWERINIYIPFYWPCNYSDLLELKLKLTHVSKMDPWCSLTILRGYKTEGMYTDPRPNVFSLKPTFAEFEAEMHRSVSSCLVTLASSGDISNKKQSHDKREKNVKIYSGSRRSLRENILKNSAKIKLSRPPTFADNICFHASITSEKLTNVINTDLATK